MSLEILPDELILHICQYLRGADVFYSFYNLNTRLNVTIEGYCRYVNLMSVSYKQFEYSVSHVIPQIGSSIRNFVLNGNWETIINKKLFSILYSSNLSLLFPQLQRLTIKWFTTEKFLSFIDILQDFPFLIELDIRFLKGDTINLIQSKILSANNNQLEIISFDQDSIDLDISEDDDPTIVYTNIRELSINLTFSKLISRLFLLVPNVTRLHVNIDELSDKAGSKSIMIDLPTLVHLIYFQLRSVNLFWTFNEITDILKAMPFLEQLALDLRTSDKCLVTEDDLNKILPSSVIKIDFFIRYYYPERRLANEISTSLASTRFSIACLLDKPRHRFLIHTIPCDLRSAILTGAIGKRMLTGWSYTQQIEDLYIYDITSLLDLLLVLQHFRRLRTLSIDMRNKSQNLTLPLKSPSITLKLSFLKQIEVSGICDIFPVLSVAPNVDYMIIDFDCLKTLLNNEDTCQLLQTQIIRINIIDWVDVESDILQSVSRVFTSLRHIVITMKELTSTIDDFILTILSLWKEKSPMSIDVKGSLSEENKTNLRQWIINHSHMKEEDSFATEYKNNWFDLWF